MNALFDAFGVATIRCVLLESALSSVVHQRGFLNMLRSELVFKHMLPKVLDANGEWWGGDEKANKVVTWRRFSDG